MASLGYAGSKTILDDYLREVRPLFAHRRGRFSALSIGRARSASSICGSRRRRSRSGISSSSNIMLLVRTYMAMDGTPLNFTRLAVLH